MILQSALAHWLIGLASPSNSLRFLCFQLVRVRPEGLIIAATAGAAV